MTFTANVRLTITLYIIGALITTGIVSYAAGASNERAVPLSEQIISECEIKDVSEESGTTEDTAALLRSAGFYGIGLDGGEFLYSPACIGEGFIP